MTLREVNIVHIHVTCGEETGGGGGNPESKVGRGSEGIGGKAGKRDPQDARTARNSTVEHFTTLRNILQKKCNEKVGNNFR